MPIYSTPLWQSEYPNFEEDKDKFLDAVKQFKEQNPSTETRSSIAGYQSPKNLQTVFELSPLWEYICQMAYKASADLDFFDNCDVALTEAWLNVNDSRQCMNSEHIHGDVFSGVFLSSSPGR